MTHLFKTDNRTGELVFVQLERVNGELQIKNSEQLINWLEETQWDTFWDIEMHEGGRVFINEISGGGSEITFTGDNGIFTMTQLKEEIQTI